MGAINDFQSQVSKAEGLARVARYKVDLFPPAGANLSTEMTRTISLFCSSITMPGHDLQTNTVKHGTEINREMVVGHGYEGTIEATFYLDQELDVKTYLDAWQESAISTTRNTVSYYENTLGQKNYVGKMHIHQLGSKSTNQTRFQFNTNTGFSIDKKTHAEAEKVYTLEVQEVFPVTIAPIEYAYATVDEVALLTVSFQYRKWEEITQGRNETFLGFSTEELIGPWSAKVRNK
jgi:hypothetical protein|tara:strand:+ start:75 stop:776 length:702 start_codon:yes stop_codon:yes gene_type:complete